MKCKAVISNILQCLFVLSLSLLTCCSNDTSANLWGTGRIRPVVTANPEVISTSGETISGIIPDFLASDNISLTVTDVNGAYSHTWESWTDYDPMTGLQASRYRVEAFYGDSTREGFDVPWLYASRTVDVADGQEVDVDLDCRLANAMWRVAFSDGTLAAFQNISLFLQTPGHSRVEYESSESRPLFMMPSRTSIVVSLTTADGKSLDFLAAVVKNVRESHLYDLTVTTSEGTDGVSELRLSFDENMMEDDLTFRLTDDFVNGAQPVVVPNGFESGATLTIERGTSWTEPLSMSVARDELSSLPFTFSTSSPSFGGLPAEINLLDMDFAVRQRLLRCGIHINETSDSIRVDFSDMISLLSSDLAGEASFFSLSAVNRFSKISRPCTFFVRTLPVDMKLLSVSPAILGIDECEMEFESPVDPQGKLRVEAFDGEGRWEQLEITRVEKINAAAYRARFKVPAGQNPVAIKVFYLGELKFAATVERTSPEFAINVDAFALKAYVEIRAQDASLRSMITGNVNIFSGSKQLAVTERDEETGIVTVAGLSENTRYDIRASLFSRPTSGKDFITPPVAVLTEKCADLSNGSFEDAKTTLKYKDLLSGGRYSQSAVPIFNQQNRTQIDLMTPKGWSTTNDKTFCMAAKNRNTWYMQPSAYIVLDSYNGGYALKLTTTAWDINGEPIADYLQESQPYVYYSRVIPEISHRAAGKLFLGDYSFNPATGEETYDEGIGFTSRPSAVSGFYKYLPCTLQPSDKGLVRVEVLGESSGKLTVIGSGEQLLTSSASYRAFSVPVVYNVLNVKATELRLMFSSTENIGTIEYETSRIVTFSNPVTSSSLGSELWIDEVSLSY